MKKKFFFSLNEKEIEKVKKMAQERGTSRSQIMRDLIQGAKL